jgi:uncharacterized membrane protein YbhN (UPF0104 family)
MRRVTLRRLLYTSFIAAAVVSLLLLLGRQSISLGASLQSTRDFEWAFHPGPLVGAFAVGTANLVLMGLVWASLFRSGGGTARPLDAVRVWLVTNFGRYIPGKVWQLGGLAVYMRDRGDSGTAALVSAVVFQVVTLVTGAAVAVATLGVRWLGAEETWIPGAIVLGLVLVIGLHPRSLQWTASRIGRWMGEEEIVVHMRPARIVGAAAGMLVAWGLYGIGLFLLMRGVGVIWQISVVYVLMGVFAASYVAGYLVLVAPGGLVVREGAMAALLVETGGIPVGVAATVALIARLWVVSTEVGALGLSMAWPGARPREDAT